MTCHKRISPLQNIVDFQMKINARAVKVERIAKDCFSCLDFQMIEPDLNVLKNQIFQSHLRVTEQKC